MLMATGVDLSRRGEGLGVQAHDQALQDALATTRGGGLVVLGGVHPQNEASKRCLKKSGFERRQSLEDLLPGEYEVWVVEVGP
jgi:RimJ/RimL family protein N-acetyltransferase